MYIYISVEAYADITQYYVLYIFFLLFDSDNDNNNNGDSGSLYYSYYIFIHAICSCHLPSPLRKYQIYIHRRTTQLRNWNMWCACDDEGLVRKRQTGSENGKEQKNLDVFMYKNMDNIGSITVSAGNGYVHHMMV